MNITYDPTAKAAYVYLPGHPGPDTKGCVHETRVMADNVTLDIDGTGTVIGVEILNVDAAPTMEVFS